MSEKSTLGSRKTTFINTKILYEAWLQEAISVGLQSPCRILANMFTDCGPPELLRKKWEERNNSYRLKPLSLSKLGGAETQRPSANNLQISLQREGDKKGRVRYSSCCMTAPKSRPVTATGFAKHALYCRGLKSYEYDLSDSPPQRNCVRATVQTN